MDRLTHDVEQLREAMVLADTSILEKVTADELSYGHASGVIEDKKHFIDAIASGRTKYESITLSNESIVDAGEVAIVRHRFEADVLIEGKPSHADIQVMQVWRSVKGEWRLLARQAFKTGL